MTPKAKRDPVKAPVKTVSARFDSPGKKTPEPIKRKTATPEPSKMLLRSGSKKSVVPLTKKLKGSKAIQRGSKTGAACLVKDLFNSKNLWTPTKAKQQKLILAN